MSPVEPNGLRARHRDLGVDVERESRDALLAEAAAGRMLRLRVPAEHVHVLLERLRQESEASMGRLVDLTAIDHGAVAHRFEVVYWLRSSDGSEDLRVHARLADESTEVESVASLWPSASWLEREIFDLFGIRFRGHPQLRRLLLDEAFEGAPLRKDYRRDAKQAIAKDDTP